MAPYYYITNRYCSLRLKCCSGATLRGQIENAFIWHVTSGIVRFCANLARGESPGEKKLRPRSRLDQLELDLT